MVLFNAPARRGCAIGIDIKGSKHTIGTVETNRDHSTLVDQRWVRYHSIGQAADFRERDAASGEIDAHQMQRRRRNPLTTKGSDVVLAATAIIEEPRRTKSDDSIPSVGLAFNRSVSRSEGFVEHK
ncbi:unannotated protein [freshwater metagenome]|uniref:Unannotated protein n=1 Tax=freshwater metagenome TaxID=449393 RepID=A0A6J7MKK2_9ZZZZ